jgi:hypothetical protein
MCRFNGDRGFITEGCLQFPFGWVTCEVAAPSVMLVVVGTNTHAHSYSELGIVGTVEGS